MNGRIINERDALQVAGRFALTDPLFYNRLVSVLSRCPTVNTEGIPLEEETMEQTIKRVVAEQLVHFKLPDGVRPKEVRLSVTYEGLMASITLEMPGASDEKKDEGKEEHETQSD